MSNKQPKYYDVQLKSDISSNFYTLKYLYILCGCFGFIWMLNRLGIFIVVPSVMNACFVGTVLLTVLTTILMFIHRFNRPTSKYLILSLTVIIVSFICAQLTFHAILLMVLPLLYSSQYARSKVIWYTYVLTIIGLSVSVIIGYYIGICDANLVLSTGEETLSTFLNHLEAGEIPLISDGDSGIVSSLLLFFVFPRAVILGSMVPILIRISTETKKRTISELRARNLAEFDNMTGCYNKNKYLSMISDYYPKFEKIGVIFWDINNLKITNDTFDHQTGDRLINMMADSFEGLENPKHAVFRTGGDEFVMIVVNPHQGSLQQIINKWQKNVNSLNEKTDIKLVSACGFSEGAGKDILEIIKKADLEMYENKKKLKGVDTISTHNRHQ